jgi:hypothetical protein
MEGRIFEAGGRGVVLNRRAQRDAKDRDKEAGGAVEAVGDRGWRGKPVRPVGISGRGREAELDGRERTSRAARPYRLGRLGGDVGEGRIEYPISTKE